MSLIEALLLGIVQGITEFLPVSSSGHLAILENLFIKKEEAWILFYAMLHLGTLFAVFRVFSKDIKRLFLEGCKCIYDFIENIKTYFHNKNHKDAKRYKIVVSNNYRKFLLLLIVSTIPTVLEGYFFQGLADKAGQNLLAPAMGLFLTGVLLLIADSFPAGKKIPKDISYRSAFIIGIFQGFAVFPGVSRLGITIVICILCGFGRKFAVRYSFLAGIPVMIGAAILELPKLPGAGAAAFGNCVAGAAAAALVGCLCIRKMLEWTKKKKFYVFSIYCFVIGTAAVVCNFVL